jgi:hypothetical protein
MEPPASAKKDDKPNSEHKPSASENKDGGKKEKHGHVPRLTVQTSFYLVGIANNRKSKNGKKIRKARKEVHREEENAFGAKSRICSCASILSTRIPTGFTFCSHAAA